MGKLSEHFTEEEYIYSDTAKRYGLNNSMNDFHRKIAVHTCNYLLEPLRSLLNQYYKCVVIICITSGYRGPELNAKVNGVPTSEHCKGCAVDITCYKVLNGVKVKINPLELYNLIKTWVKEGKISVNQCIYEVSGSSIWVHVSHHPSGKTCDKRQFLKYNNGKYTNDNT